MQSFSSIEEYIKNADNMFSAAGQNKRYKRLKRQKYNKCLQNVRLLGYNTMKDLYIGEILGRMKAMVLSMTGFGRGKAEDDNYEISVEIKTINHRYLDINLRLPRNLSFLEDEARKRIQQSISRGRTEVYVSYKNKSQDQVNVTLNESAVNAYISVFQLLAEKFGIENKVDMSTVAGIDELFTITQQEENEDILRTLLMSALDQSLEVLNQMRRKEGSFLVEDVLEHCTLIAGRVDAVEERSPLLVEDYRKKLEQRIKELLKSTELDEARFNTEVAYFADRSNITEEIIRLRSHLEQLKSTVKAGGPVGRKLDFIVQEMNREANTIGSKSGDITITNHVVEIKSEIEKIREQIQNLE